MSGGEPAADAELSFRELRVEDHPRIIAVVDRWWGGRPMAGLLPKLFFIHFHNTSFAVERGGALVGVLVGFRSQSDPNAAYIHFVGVDPSLRGQNVGRRLYERFFAKMRELGCRRFSCLTSPENKNSIAFHTRMGFRILPGGRMADGVPCQADYNGPGADRVCFVYELPD